MSTPSTAMTDSTTDREYGELPPGWEWDPESPTATQYDGTIYPHADAPIEDATPSDETWAKITREIAANAWAIYRKRWAEAIEVGRKAEATRHAPLVEAARAVVDVERDQMLLDEDMALLREAVAALEKPDDTARALHLVWNGEEWTDDRCGCRYHPDDQNMSHGGAPHVHRCETHSKALAALEDQ